MLRAGAEGGGRSEGAVDGHDAARLQRGAPFGAASAGESPSLLALMQEKRYTVICARKGEADAKAE